MVTPLVDKIDFQYQIVGNQDHMRRSIGNRTCILRNVPMKAALTMMTPAGCSTSPPLPPMQMDFHLSRDYDTI